MNIYSKFQIETHQPTKLPIFQHESTNPPHPTITNIQPTSSLSPKPPKKHTQSSPSPRRVKTRTCTCAPFYPHEEFETFGIARRRTNVKRLCSPFAFAYNLYRTRGYNIMVWYYTRRLPYFTYYRAIVRMLYVCDVLFK